MPIKTKIKLSQLSGSLPNGSTSAFTIGQGAGAAAEDYMTFDTTNLKVILPQ